MSPAVKRLKAKDGTALLLVVASLAALTVLLGSLLAGVNSSLARRHADWRDQTLRALASAGIQYGAAQIAERGAGYTGEEKMPLGDGYVSIAVSATASGHTYEIRSVGLLHNDERIRREAELIALVRVDGRRIESIQPIDATTPGGA